MLSASSSLYFSFNKVMSSAFYFSFNNVMTSSCLISSFFLDTGTLLIGDLVSAIDIAISVSKGVSFFNQQLTPFPWNIHVICGMVTCNVPALRNTPSFSVLNMHGYFIFNIFLFMCLFVFWCLHLFDVNLGIIFRLDPISMQGSFFYKTEKQLVYTVNNTTAGEVTFKKGLNSGITYFHLKVTTSHKHSPLVPTRAYINLGRTA